MLRILNNLKKTSSKNFVFYTTLRTFLSQTYYCNETWQDRLKHPLFQKVNLEDLYQQLDQRFQKEKQISAIDVDVFSNVLKDDSYDDELLDLTHKLRLSAESSNILNSTAHAIIRTLFKRKKEELLNVLDDRINYGIFLDHYTTNILLDTFWKEKDYVSGARIASQLMLQEDTEHPISFLFSILHCYKYLLSKQEWPIVSKEPEPEEEVKVRVKYIRNEFNDQHFDLQDPNKIIGKTLIFLTKGKNDALNCSFNILGLSLYNDLEKLKVKVQNIIDNKMLIYEDILNLFQEGESREITKHLQTASGNILDILENYLKKNILEKSEQDIAAQNELYCQWEKERMEALDEQKKRVSIKERLENIKEIQQKLKERENKLWFFENEEQIELDIEGKKIHYKKRWFGKKKTPRRVDEDYVPPEI